MTPIEKVNYHIDVTVLYMLELIFEVMSTALASVILVQALVLLVSRKKKNVRFSSTGGIKKLLIPALTIQLTLSISQIPFMCAAYIIQVKGWKITGDVLSSTYPTSKYQPSFVLVQNLLKIPRICITDGLVVWRAWCLYPHSRLVKSLLSFSMFCLIGIFIGHISLRCIRSFTDVLDGKDEVYNMVVGIRAFIDFGVNLLATALIFRIAWIHHRTLKTASVNHSKSRVAFVLSRLIETGALVCAVQLVNAVSTVTYKEGDPANPGFMASDLIDICISGFISAHPGLIIIVCHRSFSTEDSMIFAPGTELNAPREEVEEKSRLTTIRFASDRTEAANTDSDGSQKSQQLAVSHEDADLA